MTNEVAFVEPVTFPKGAEVLKLQLYQLKLRKISLERRLTSFLHNNNLEFALNYPTSSPNERPPQEFGNLTLLDLMVAIWRLREEPTIFQQYQPSEELINAFKNLYAEAEKILLETIEILYQFYFPQTGLEIFKCRLQNLEELKRIFTKDYSYVEIPFVWQVAALIQDLPFALDPQKFKQDSEIILKIFESLMSPQEFYKALAIAHGANLIDVESKIGLQNQAGSTEVPASVIQALKGDTSVITNSASWKEACGYTPPSMEIGKLLKLVQDHDLESIILTGLKLKDKIDSANQKLVDGINLSAKEKISTYQDCMAMLHLYGPLIDMAGFRDLANEFTSTALEFLNRQILPEEIISGLEKTYKIGEQIYNEAVLVGKGMPQTSQTDHQGLGLILVEEASSLVVKIFGSSAVIMGNRNPNLDALARRLKSFGSFLSKLIKPLKDSEQFDSGRIDLNIGTPDQIGVKVVIPEDASDQEDAYRQKVADLVSGLIFTIINLRLALPISSEDEDNKDYEDYEDYEDTKTVLGCAVKHTRGEPPISFINFNEKEFEAIKAKIQEQFPGIDVSYETRKTGYTAIHVNAVVQVGEAKIGVEIQIVRARDNLNNTYGLSAHGAYKSGINTHTNRNIQTDFMTVSFDLAKRHGAFYNALSTGLLATVKLCSRSASRLHVEYGVPLDVLLLDCFQ
jgi:hypothetical protein